MKRRNSHTSSLSHYTRSMFTLLSILKEGFKFGYCTEDFKNGRFVAIPMVCFCDIPLVESEEHAEKYGSFAIGIKKDFFIDNYKKYVGPVWYLMVDYAVVGTYLLKNMANDLAKKLPNDMFEASIVNKRDTQTMLHYSLCSSKMLGFMKPYETIHDNKTYVTYDECEWRFVLPEHPDPHDFTYSKWFWNEVEYYEWRDNKDDKFLDGVTLPFSIDDISFLIVPNELTKRTLLDELTKLDTICGTKIEPIERKKLLSKIISFEQIKNDDYIDIDL